METLTDFPKIECPFIRQTFKVNVEDFKRVGSKYGLRTPEVYLVVNKINPGFEWVFDNKYTVASEKLDGTNIKIKTENGRLVAMMNRKNVIDPLQIIGGKNHLIEGLFRAIGKNYVAENGEQAGELVGPKLQGNPYRLDFHEWYPFDKARKDLLYRSFHEHERTFDNLWSWFKDFLFSRYYQKIHKKEIEKDMAEGRPEQKVFAEGVVFYNPERQKTEKSYQAKLRRNMFPWFYEDIEIYDYNKEGKDEEIEDQSKFD